MVHRKLRVLISVWVAPAVILAGVTAGLVRLSAPTGKGAAIDRLIPRAAGSVWVYRTTFNGADSGLETVRVAGRGLLPGPGEVDVLEYHFEKLFGLGPVDETDYVGTRGNRYVLFASKSSSKFRQHTPYQAFFTAPMTPGHQATYDGTSGTDKVHAVTVIDKVEGRDVAGRHFTGCGLVHSDATQTPAGHPPQVQHVQTTVCPGVGVVQAESDYMAVGHLSEKLIRYVSPELSMGALTPPEPVPAAPPAPPVTPLPGGSAWTDTRTHDVIFPPSGGDGLFVTAESDGAVTATETATGSVRWRMAVPGVAVTAPVVAKGMVLVGGADKSLLGVDPISGLTRWAVRLGDVLAGPPVVVGAVAVVASEDRQVRGIGLGDGKTLWGPIGFGPLFGPPVLLNGSVVLADTSGTVTALRPADGSTAWSLSGNSPSSSLGVAGDVVAYGDAYGDLVAIDGRGHVRWARAMGVNVLRAPAGTQGTVAAVVGSRRLVGLDVSDGHQRWSASTDTDIGVNPVAVAGSGAIAVMTEDARLWRYQAADGTPRGAPIAVRVPGGTNPSVRVDPVVFDAMLVVTIHDSTAVATNTIAAYPDRGGLPLRLISAVRTLPAGFEGPASFLPDGAMVLAAADGSVRVVPQKGPARALSPPDRLVPFVAAAGSLVLAQRATELVALPVSGGAPAWRLPTGPPASEGAVAVVAGTAVAGIPGVGLIGVDVASGHQLWRQAVTETAGLSPPLVAPDQSVVWAVGGIVDVDPATGHVRWRLPGFGAYAPVAAADGVVVVVGLSPESNGVVLAVELSTGALRWQKPFSPTRDIGPSIGDGVVVASDSRGTVHAFDLATGAERWTHAVGAGGLDGSPVIVGRHVVVDVTGHKEDLRQRDHSVVVLDLATGAWQASFEPPHVAPAVNGFGSGPAGSVVVPTSVRGPVVELVHFQDGS